ncbi:MAG: SAM-dependent chlorinase/fluorinase [Gemmataceae bacterium]|nr:SAM-dependent chlorinase/fluorinase [Gemmataceae bacterium]
MPDPIITLTTDFGEASPYVAAMKGVILSINPTARIVDLGHQVPPQDLRHAAHFLAAAIPYFPPSVIHIVVVDPGVGTDRSLLYVEISGHRLLVPDNGCWTALGRLGLPHVRRLTERRYWREPVSNTFHGRDILAPVAAHLSLGIAADQLGPQVAAYVQLQTPVPHFDPQRSLWSGEVAFIDAFGNLISNIPATTLGDGPARIEVNGHPVPRRVRTYGEADPGALVALVSSTGMLEVAVVQGHAANYLNVKVGAPVAVLLID